MSLDSYSSLSASIAGWLDRTDLTARIPDFIRLAEAQANRRLDCRLMYEYDPAFSIAAETVNLPEGFAGVKAFRLQTDPVAKLTYVKPDEMDDIQDAAGWGVGRPKYYTIVGSTFVFSPAPDATYTARLRYRRTVPLLSDTTTTNWLLDNHPDAYLYGALTQAEPYLKNDERLMMWGNLFTTAIDDINADNATQAYGSTVTMRTRSA